MDGLYIPEVKAEAEAAPMFCVAVPLADILTSLNFDVPPFL